MYIYIIYIIYIYNRKERQRKKETHVSRLNLGEKVYIRKDKRRIEEFPQWQRVKIWIFNATKLWILVYVKLVS